MLTEGKATHSVFAGLDIVSMGYSLQLSIPTDELMVPPRHGRHRQQQGERRRTLFRAFRFRWANRWSLPMKSL